MCPERIALSAASGAREGELFRAASGPSMKGVQFSGSAGFDMRGNRRLTTMFDRDRPGASATPPRGDGPAGKTRIGLDEGHTNSLSCEEGGYLFVRAPGGRHAGGTPNRAALSQGCGLLMDC